MNSRKLHEVIPAALPVLCAILVITIDLALADRFFSSPPTVAKLSPDTYARRIHYVAAAEFQAVAIAAALGFGFLLLLRLACDTESGWRFGFATAMVVLACVSATLLITPERPSPLHTLLRATALQNFQIAFERATGVAAAVLVTVAALLRRQRDLWYLLLLGAVLLAGDVLLAMFAGRWAATGVDELVNAIVFGRIVFDTLFLAATWIPAAIVNTIRCDDVQPA